MTEAIKIVVAGNDEQGGCLPAQDALNQVLDSLALITDAIDEDVRKDLDWRLMDMSMNSPLVASMELSARTRIVRISCPPCVQRQPEPMEFLGHSLRLIACQAA